MFDNFIWNPTSNQRTVLLRLSRKGQVWSPSPLPNTWKTPIGRWVSLNWKLIKVRNEENNTVGAIPDTRVRRKNRSLSPTCMSIVVNIATKQRMEEEPKCGCCVVIPRPTMIKKRKRTRKMTRKRRRNRTKTRVALCLVHGTMCPFVQSLKHPSVAIVLKCVCLCCVKGMIFVLHLWKHPRQQQPYQPKRPPKPKKKKLWKNWKCTNNHRHNVSFMDWYGPDYFYKIHLRINGSPVLHPL